MSQGMLEKINFEKFVDLRVFKYIKSADCQMGDASYACGSTIIIENEQILPKADEKVNSPKG